MLRLSHQCGWNRSWEYLGFQCGGLFLCYHLREGLGWGGVASGVSVRWIFCSFLMVGDGSVDALGEGDLIARRLRGVI